MYVSLEERIKEITKGVCPYKNKVCDGLCNNCGILAKSENTFAKIIYICIIIFDFDNP